MSIKVMTMVWDKFPASGSELLAMLALADWCDDQGGSLYPSMRAVAHKIRVSEKQARRIVQGFVTGGYLAVVGNAAGGAPGSTKQFRLDVQKLAALPGVDAPKSIQTPPMGGTPPTGGSPPMDGSPTPPMGGSPTPPMGVPEGSHPCPERAPTHGSLTVIEPSIEPSLGGERAQAPAATATGLAGVADGDADVIQPVAAAKRKTGLPEGFVPDSVAVEMAGALRVCLSSELASFADHHCARGSVMADWQAAFRTWLRNAAKFAQRDAQRSAGSGETVYQRSMRERVEQLAPAIARKAAGTPAVHAVEFFNTVEAAPALRIGSRS